MKIYTRRGDRGETDLFGGGRVAKDDLRVAAYGDVDELNACVGVAAAASDQDELRAFMHQIQNSLFDLGSQLATPQVAQQKKHGHPCVDIERVGELEREIDRLEDELEPLTSFILPGGSATAAALHHARTVCRRAERSAVALDRAESLEPAIVQYLNRLSDLLFTMARVANSRSGISDITWLGRER
ncbi:MAG: cob(I)yrinic acid a,c-diamide adenosyltransferase [Deltaproteobacteria bacterium]|nr:cob(I)yrinic acid a,c-diamide adenosyltransferase [Deltaproteobacteria bacterium]MBW2386919.1 cob(I)yrinic acid a,c-diamide adenosyltransferase [Deltaproteobacteria bacterium]